MKVLITGSRGYIGSTLAKTFVLDGSIPFGVDRELRPEGSAIYGLYHQASFEDEAVADMVVDLKIDTICHLAADASVPDSLKNPGRYFHNNVGATIQLLNSLIKRNWKGNFIFSSSAAVYPSSSSLASESDPPDPMNPYGLSKLMGEQILLDYHLAHGINVMCFRYFNVAGAWDDVGDHRQSDHVIQKLIRATIHEYEFELYSDKKNTPDGTCVRDFLHVRDVCDAHIVAADYLKKNPGFYIYNLGTSVGTSIRQLIVQFTLSTNKQLRFKVGDPRPGDPDYLVADGHRFVADTGYTYKHSDLNNIIKTAWDYGQVKSSKYGL